MIDVVVPIFNQFQLVAQCLDGLRAQSHIGRIILVDDASTDMRVADYLDAVSVDPHLDIMLVRHSANEGFVGAANHGMEYVSTEFAAIINSDTVPVGDTALWALAWSMHNHGANVGGAKLLFAPGSRYGDPLHIQHAGVAFNPDGYPYHPFMHLHPGTKAANYAKMVTAVTGAVFGVRVDVWRSLDGFDQLFAPGVYEDVDYCLRAGKVVYEPGSEWLHVMHGSQVDGHNLFDNETRNIDRLFRRWSPIKCDEELYFATEKAGLYPDAG